MTRIQPKVLLLGASVCAVKDAALSTLAAGAIRCIKHAYPEADISLLDYSKKSEVFNVRIGGRRFLVPLVNIRFTKRLFLENNVVVLAVLAALLRLLPSSGLKDRIISDNPALSSIYDSDIVASVAGGDGFSDRRGIKGFLETALPLLVAVLLGKRLVLLPQTIGPFAGRAARVIARYILSAAEAVYSRDYNGLLEMRSLLGPSVKDGRFCYDMGFAAEPGEEAMADAFEAVKKNGRPAVGLNVRGRLYMDGGTVNDTSDLTAGYRELMEEVIGFLIEKKEADVVLIPHVSERGDESDAGVCEALHEDMSRLYGDRVSIFRGTDAEAAAGRCDLFIGSRMRLCIAALSRGVPSVSIAYSDKFLGVMEAMGLENCVADPRRSEAKEVLSVIGRNYDRRDAIAEVLKKTVPHVKSSVLALFHEVPL